MGNKQKIRTELAKYFQASGARDPLYRVEPCLMATAGKIEAVRQSCASVIYEVGENSNEGEALVGVSEILRDMKTELHDAVAVLREGLA